VGETRRAGTLMVNLKTSVLYTSRSHVQGTTPDSTVTHSARAAPEQPKLDCANDNMRF